MKDHPSPSGFAALIGIHWADEKHDICEIPLATNNPVCSYQQQIAKGKPHNTVIRSLAFKWIRIAFRCWKE